MIKKSPLKNKNLSNFIFFILSQDEPVKKIKTLKSKIWGPEEPYFNFILLLHKQHQLVLLLQIKFQPLVCDYIIKNTLIILEKGIHAISIL